MRYAYRDAGDYGSKFDMLFVAYYKCDVEIDRRCWTRTALASD